MQKGALGTKLSLLIQHQKLISKDLKDLLVAPTQCRFGFSGKEPIAIQPSASA